MADRLFAGALLLIAIGYTYMAFALIEAPFQYDPLGPESWPRVLGIIAIACLVTILLRPDVSRFNLSLPTWGRLAILVVLLFGYAEFYQSAGFILSTFAFCTLLSVMLGARIAPALLFGVVTGVAGYFLCTRLLELNLPAGIFDPYI